MKEIWSYYWEKFIIWFYTVLYSYFNIVSIYFPKENQKEEHFKTVKLSDGKDRSFIFDFYKIEDKQYYYSFTKLKHKKVCVYKIYLKIHNNNQDEIWYDDLSIIIYPGYFFKPSNDKVMIKVLINIYFSHMESKLLEQASMDAIEEEI